MNTILGYIIPKPKKTPAKVITQKNTAGQNYIQALYYGRDDYSPKVREIMSQFGDTKIERMEVRRTPLGKLLTTTLDVLTFYQIERNNPYDELYHLHLAIMLVGGTTITIEKNEVISMEVNPPPRDKTQTREVVLDKTVNYTLNSIMQNTKDRMGKKFFYYSARNENCQDFILNILVANGLDTPELTEFIKQDAIRIFGDMVYFRKFSNSTTDFASRIDVLKEGAGKNDGDPCWKQYEQFGMKMKNGKLVPNCVRKKKGKGECCSDCEQGGDPPPSKPHKQQPKKEGGKGENLVSPSPDNALSNVDIENILRPRTTTFGGVYSKDTIPKKLKKGFWYVINMENEKDGDGTHWVCFKYGDSIEYYDSFGFPPPNSILRLSKNDIHYSKKQIQNEDSTACGYFCIARILSPLDYGAFLKKFSKNTMKNEQILKSMLPHGV